MIFVIVAAILFFDQASKVLITQKLILHQSDPVLQGIFHLTLVHNRGAAFGLLKNQTPVFIITAFVAIILIFLDLKKRSGQGISLINLSLALILAGALGNCIDRLRFGYVIDFLDFRVWPVFNIADSAITIGAILLGWHILKFKHKE